MSLHTDRSPIQAQDHAIDQVLTALRDTPTPTGLEARIAHRLLQAQIAPTRPATGGFIKECFAVILASMQRTKDPRILLAAATALAIALAIPLTQIHHNPQLANWPTGNWQTESQPRTTTTSARKSVVLSRDSPGSIHALHPKDLLTAHNTSVSEGFPTRTTTGDDPDTIALAETLAPSQPIPPQSLTSQERTLQNATRQDRPIEVAELELSRAPFHRIAHARERLTFAQVAQGLLAPLASAERLEPTISPVDPEPSTQPASPR